MTDWNHACVLCAARGKQTRLESGHCCVPCSGRLTETIADIARLAADAAAFIAPGSTGASGSRPVPSSRPPLTVDALDPELTQVPVPGQPPHVWPTVLQVVEGWERLARAEQKLAPYGPASAARISDGLYAGTSASLVGCVAFLGGQVAWMTTEPTFPLEDFADEMRACVRVLRRWDVTAEDRGQVVLCPTLHEDEGECRARLHYRDWDEQVTCPRCRVTRDASTLVAVAMSDGREVWLDPEAAAKWLGIGESTLRLWAKRGQVERKNGRYRVRHGMTA
jgi:hypothetical protein